MAAYKSPRIVEFREALPKSGTGKVQWRVFTVNEKPVHSLAVLRTMSKFVPITVAANALGVSATTLRRWEAAGRLVPDRTVGGQRRYDLAALLPERTRGAPAPRRTVAYARVSSHDQKGDLERQKQVLELYCASQGWTFKQEAQC
jgi:hypothetical protein